MLIITAWQHFSPEVNVKGVKKCCMTNIVGGNDGDMLWKGSEEDDEGTDCEDGKNASDQ
jgi:hypothetical protein